MQNICNIKMHQKSNIYQWKMAFGEPFTERHNMASYFYKNAIRKKKSVVSREYLNLYAPVCYSYTLWHTWNYRLQLTKFKVRLETFFRKVTWNMTIFSTIQSTTIKSSRNLWTSAHTVKTFSLGALFFCCYLSKLPPEFAWSASVYLCRLSSVWTFKSLGILLLIKLFSEHSCPADWSTVTTPTVLLFSHIFFFLSFKQSTQPKPCEENASFPNFLPVENRVKDDCRGFFSLTLQKAAVCNVGPHPLQKNIKVYKWNFCIWSSFQIW